jgi:alpha-mannosidase
LRPQSPDYLELRLLGQSTTLFPGGLPFHQREGGRMLDIILVPPGEPTHVFDLAIGLDREQPMQTALGLVTPTTVVPTTKGPPHVGAKGWLFHLDASNLVLTSLRPGGAEGSVDLTDAVTARLLECNGFSTAAELRCVRNPQRVALLDGRGQLVMEGTSSNDAALFHVGPGELVQVQIQFTV